MRSFPCERAVTVQQLELDPHPVLARLLASTSRSRGSDALDGWLVTRHDLALEVMRDAATFTVDDPRFSTAQVIGPSMLARRRPTPTIARRSRARSGPRGP